MVGYSDDNWILAPSLSALQDMISTCEEYASRHNLKFSTDPLPSKCKTKCMAFLKTQRVLPQMMLNGNPLPWVESLVHLGVRVTNKIDGCQQDIREKIARYVDKCCNLNQEFHFSHPITKVRVNDATCTTVIFTAHSCGIFSVMDSSNLKVPTTG